MTPSASPVLLEQKRASRHDATAGTAASWPIWRQQRYGVYTESGEALTGVMNSVRRRAISLHRIRSRDGRELARRE